MFKVARLDDPIYWRERAREARLTALSMYDLDIRRILDGVAESYDKLAEAAERRKSPQQNQVRAP
jgi:hypothetical protein